MLVFFVAVVAVVVAHVVVDEAFVISVLNAGFVVAVVVNVFVVFVLNVVNRC